MSEVISSAREISIEEEVDSSNSALLTEFSVLDELLSVDPGGSTCRSDESNDSGGNQQREVIVCYLCTIPLHYFWSIIYKSYYQHTVAIFYQ